MIQSGLQVIVLASILILNQTFSVYFGVGGYISIQDNNRALNITSVSITQSTGITTDVVYSDDLVQYMSNQSKTIGRYASIEEPIANYQIGQPTFMSGQVYKRVKNNWVTSTSSDTTDCICRRIIHGTSKEICRCHHICGFHVQLNHIRNTW